MLSLLWHHVVVTVLGEGRRSEGKAMFDFRCLAAAALAFGSIPVGSVALAQSTWTEELKAGCNAGKGQDCSNLGSQLARNSSGQADLAGARAAYEKGCQLKSATSCAELYKMLSLGEGGPVDKARAATLAHDACNTGIFALRAYLKGKGLCAD